MEKGVRELRENKESAERRNEFVDAAEKLFRQNGIMDTTINSIVKEMNVAKGLFYYYFNSKEDVIEAISEKYSSAFRSMMAQQEECPDFEDMLERTVETSVRSFMDLLDRLHTTDEGVDLTPLSMRSIKDAREAISSRLEELIREGNRIGELHARYEKYLADMLAGGLTELAKKGEATAGEITEIITDLIRQSGKE